MKGLNVDTKPGKAPEKWASSDVGISISPSGAATGPATAPVEIPKGMKWPAPKTLVEAKPAAALRGGGQKAVVTYVGDGDGAKLRTAGDEVVNCRIDSIDAPEKARPEHRKNGQPYGGAATKTLQDMILNKEVTVRITKPAADAKFKDRSYCQIEIQGKDVSQEMVKAGAAWVYEQYVKDPSLKGMQDEARQAKRGLWGLPGTPEYPPAFRAGPNYRMR